MNHANKFPKRDISRTPAAVVLPSVTFIRETCSIVEMIYSILGKG